MDPAKLSGLQIFCGNQPVNLHDAVAEADGDTATIRGVTLSKEEPVTAALGSRHIYLAVLTGSSTDLTDSLHTPASDKCILL